MSLLVFHGVVSGVRLKPGGMPRSGRIIVFSPESKTDVPHNEICTLTLSYQTRLAYLNHDVQSMRMRCGVLTPASANNDLPAPSQSWHPLLYRFSSWESCVSPSYRMICTREVALSM